MRARLHRFARSRFAIFACLLGVGLSAWSSAALAADSREAAVKLYGARQFRQAIKQFEIVAQAHRNDPSPLYYQALCYQQLGDFPRAKGLYRRVCQDFPESREAEMASAFLKRVDPSFVGADRRSPPGEPDALAAGGPGASRPGVGGAVSGGAGQLMRELAALNSIRETKMSPEELAKLPDQSRVPFHRKTRSNHLYVDAQVNKRPIKVIFDTGAEVCLFGRRQLEAAGVNVDTSGPAVPISGVGGQKVAHRMVADITVGDITRRIPIMVQDDLPTDPLLGESFFNGFRYEIDNRAGFIHFVKTEGGISKARIFEPTDVVAVPFTAAGNNMVVMAEVNGRPCEMYFDTGASGICFSAMSAALLGIRVPADARPIMSGGVGGATAGYAFNIERIKLGPILKTNVPITVIQSGLPLPLLGQTFFGDRRFTIDNDKHVIKFAH